MVSSRAKYMRILDGTPDGKWPLVRSKHRWEVSTEVYLELVGLEKGYWILPSQNRGKNSWLANTITKLQFS